MLQELSVVEQRYLAVREVLDGAKVTDVAPRYGVDRQTVHRWLVRYATEGLGALADRSSRPDRCPHQIAPEVEARIVALRRAHPGWGPRTILPSSAASSSEPPSRSSIYRCLVRHRLIDPQKRRRDARGLPPLGALAARWSSGRWTSWAACCSPTARELKIDHRHRRPLPLLRLRPARAAGHGAAGLRGAPQPPWPATASPSRSSPTTARCSRRASAAAPAGALRPHLPGENGIRHLLTAPRSPTTTGKVERFHKTVRKRAPCRAHLRLARGGPGRARRLGRQLQLRAAAPGDRGRAAGPTLRAGAAGLR